MMIRVPEPANDSMEGFSKWLESEDGQHSMEAMDYVFEALNGAIRSSDKCLDK